MRRTMNYANVLDAILSVDFRLLEKRADWLHLARRYEWHDGVYVSAELLGGVCDAA